VIAQGRASWESRSVYNATTFVAGGGVGLIYRAHAEDIVSRLGLARSTDGPRFVTEPEPVVVPEHDYEEFGYEDPRVVRIDDVYHLTCTGWDRTAARLCLATSTDLRRWTEHGPLFPGFNTFRGVRVDGSPTTGRATPPSAWRRPTCPPAARAGRLTGRGTGSPSPT